MCCSHADVAVCIMQSATFLNWKGGGVILHLIDLVRSVHNFIVTETEALYLQSQRQP